MIPKNIPLPVSSHEDSGVIEDIFYLAVWLLDSYLASKIIFSLQMPKTKSSYDNTNLYYQ